MDKKGWVGVDLDGTLAEYDGWQGDNKIGKPVPKMVKRVKQWLSEGINVKIFTARVSHSNPNRLKAIITINEFSKENFGVILPVTAEKDYNMIELWDDRCVQVIPNTGVALQELLRGR